MFMGSDHFGQAADCSPQQHSLIHGVRILGTYVKINIKLIRRQLGLQVVMNRDVVSKKSTFLGSVSSGF